MNERPAQVLQFEVASDRAALGRLAQSLAVHGGLKDSVEKRFAGEISVAGLAQLLNAHFADVAQTAIHALPPKIYKRVLARLYYEGRDGRKHRTARQAREKLLAQIQFWQKRLREQMQVEGLK